MEQSELIPHLFRSEYRKVTSVLCKLFGIAHIEIAEDIASDTFLQAAETWPLKGIPENPVAWLYTVAKNKALNRLKRDQLFQQKIARQLSRDLQGMAEITIDLSPENIKDSQLQMMFALSTPAISLEAQVGLSLRILCGFGIEEIADAFLSNKETINKRLFRAKEKLRESNMVIAMPAPAEIGERLDAVMTTLYLLFNEGYYSHSQNTQLRKDLCLEAMRLAYLLIEHPATNLPPANALMALMCFQASRFEARTDSNGEVILYEEQDETLWSRELIDKGNYYLVQAAAGNSLSRYHVEAAIAYWHTIKADTVQKWEHILQLYDQLLQMEYSPIAALNRTFALAKARGKTAAIGAAEKLALTGNHLYYSLLATLYTDTDNKAALHHWQKAFTLAKSPAERTVINKKIATLLTILSP